MFYFLFQSGNPHVGDQADLDDGPRHGDVAESQPEDLQRRRVQLPAKQAEQPPPSATVEQQRAAPNQPNHQSGNSLDTVDSQPGKLGRRSICRRRNRRRLHSTSSATFASEIWNQNSKPSRDAL